MKAILLTVNLLKSKMKKILVFIFMCFALNIYSQNRMIINSNKLILLNNIDTLISNYNEWQSFKTFDSELLNMKIVDKYINLFSKKAKLINHIKPNFIKTFYGKKEVNSIEFKQINISEFKEMLTKNINRGIGFKILNKNISFGKIDSGLIKILMVRQSKITNSLGIKYNVIDTVLMKINVNKNNSLKIDSIAFINPKSYQFELINDKDFDQIPDEIDTLKEDKIEKIKDLKAKPISKPSTKPILKSSKNIKHKNQTILKNKVIGFSVSPGMSIVQYYTDNLSMVYYPKDFPVSIFCDAYYKSFFFQNKLYLKVSLNVLNLNYELRNKINNLKTDNKSFSIGFCTGLGYVKNISKKLYLDVDINLLLNKIFTSSSSYLEKNESFKDILSLYLVYKPSIGYRINEKSTLLFGFNVLYGNIFYNENSDPNYSIINSNNEFSPLQNSTKNTGILSSGFNLGFEYKIK